MYSSTVIVQEACRSELQWTVQLGVQSKVLLTTLWFCLQFVSLGCERTRQAPIYGGEHGSLGKDEAQGMLQTILRLKCCPLG